MNAQQLVDSWLAGGRASAGPDGLVLRPPADAAGPAKWRRAYHWITDQAVHVPYHDLEFGPPVAAGRDEHRLDLPRSASYASFVLLPLLTLLTGRRMVFVGAPGRGKTTMATLMALLSGVPLEEARRAVQHGHPQLTIADLLGSPLPGDLLKASAGEGVRVAWRRWIGLRVKVIDEYNRIPTKTQSALLSLMAEGYAEMYEEVVRCGPSAWYLTANDDLGGGTFPVIEALKDRIDVVVRCTPFHGHLIDRLAERLASGRQPEEYVPADLIFTDAELDAAGAAVRAVDIPADVRDVLGFLLGQLDFCRRASDVLEYQTKDTLHLAGRRVAHVCTEDCPLDKHENLCTQTESGVSARAFQTLLHYAQALAYFRGEPAVGLDDVRQLLPWVLHDKLPQNPQSAFFQKAENQVYLTDRVGWIRQLFDRATAQHAAYQPVRRPTAELRVLVEGGLAHAATGELKRRQGLVRRRIDEVLAGQERNGPVHEDLVLLKSLYARCQNEIERRGRG